uniref:Sodium/potassium/calcium exchanger 5-like n=1 Tax=Dermatophagoides pteronyssinus TaxID=6956 RepID=A0A6P6XPZ4_DERPT|nr:sodium/potassium/calcium exchanger 5-like [Dermatophagoides pteronyssinus]
MVNIISFISLIMIITTTTTTFAQSTTMIPRNNEINQNQSSISTDTVIRNIIFNQSTEYYDDELILEQMLAAANMSQPPPETWRAIVNLLTRGLNVTHLQYHLLNNKQNDTKQQQHQSSMTKQSKTGLKDKTLSLSTLKHDDNNNNINNNDDEQNLTILKSTTKSHIESAIDEFPPDFMTDNFRQNGGFIVHIIIFIYLSLALAVICDEYFLKSLEYISEALHLPSDIAGATFMAIGTSAPELFTSVIGVFISDNDIGTGTIVGSAVFNLIAIPGACGFAAYYNLKNMPKINPFPIIRDTIFYVLTIITLILCIKDNRVDWIESITLIALYIVYIIVMYFNAQVSHMIGKATSAQFRRNSSDHSYDNNDDDQEKRKKRRSTIVDNESRPLLLTDDSVKRLSPPPAYQSGGDTYQVSQQQQQTTTNEQVDLSKIHLTLAENGRFKEIQSDENRSQSSGKQQSRTEIIDLEQQLIDDEIDTDWSSHPFIRFILIPFKIIFFITLPKPTRFCFVITFVSSIIWIACLTYFIVWMVTLVGYTLGIPDTVSGITVLAAGTSIPELISSYLIVKKAGLADMAICNSIGSNIFDILFCLGLPWLLKSSIVIVTNGFGLATLANSYIPIQSTALPITSLTLLLTIFAMIIIFRTSRWRLNLKLGILCTLVYIVFVVTSTSLELNV